MGEKVLVTPAELADLMKSEKLVIIDTRAPDAYGTGHIPGAVNVHDIFTYLATSTPESFASFSTCPGSSSNSRQLPKAMFSEAVASKRRKF